MAVERLSVERGDGMVPVSRSRPRGPLEAAGRVAGFRAEQHRQPRDRALIIFALAAQVANPCREVRDGDQFLAEPREVCNVAQVHDACRTFMARDVVRMWLLGGWCLVHSATPGYCAAETTLRWMMISQSRGGQ